MGGQNQRAAEPGPGPGRRLPGLRVPGQAQGQLGPVLLPVRAPVRPLARARGPERVPARPPGPVQQPAAVPRLLGPLALALRARVPEPEPARGLGQQRAERRPGLREQEPGQLVLGQLVPVPGQAQVGQPRLPVQVLVQVQELAAQREERARPLVWVPPVLPAPHPPS